MSRSQSIFGARNNSLATVATTARSTRIWQTGAGTAFTYLFVLSIPATASALVVGHDNVRSCESAASPVASKSEAILGGAMSALEAMQASQRVDACSGASVVSSQPVVAISSEMAIATIAADADVDYVKEAVAVTAIPFLRAQAQANFSGKQFGERSEPFAAIALAKFMAPFKSQHIVTQKFAPDLTSQKFASAEISNEYRSPTPTTLSESRPEQTVKSPINGKPDIFGSVALRVSHIPLDGKWIGVGSGRESTMARAALIGTDATFGTNHEEKNILLANEWIIAFAKFIAPFKSQLVVPQQIAPDATSQRFASAEISNENRSPMPTTLSESRPEQTVKSPFNGKPDIFGSVALRVSHTPLDRKWSGAQNSRESAIIRATLVRAGVAISANHKKNNIRAVNRWVNANIQYVDDRKLYGSTDHWASAGATLKSGRGDCEDFAIAKMQLLQASGVKASEMFLVIAKDLVRRSDHSVLVIRVENEMLVLDNETDQILNAEDVRDYRPIMSYSANGKWLHGYPAKPTRTQMASLAVGR